jgi:hypothetical protein
VLPLALVPAEADDPSSRRAGGGHRRVLAGVLVAFLLVGAIGLAQAASGPHWDLRGVTDVTTTTAPTASNPVVTTPSTAAPPTTAAPPAPHAPKGGRKGHGK